MKDKKILVLDLDGTLLNSEKKISPRTFDALMHIQQEGHRIMLASGRPTPGVRRFADILHLADYDGLMLTFNGAQIIRCETKEVVYSQTIPPHTIPEIIDFANEHDCGLITYDGDEAICGTRITDYVALEVRINQIAIRQVSPFLPAINFPCNKFLMTAEPADAEKYVEILGQKFADSLSIYRSEPFFVEIMPKGVDKASAIDHLLQTEGLTKENVICCGDGFNDISMIKYAGVGVAMANAQPVVKEAADFITGSCDEDGLVTVIQKYIL